MPAVIPPRPFRIGFSGRVYPSGLHLNIEIPSVDFRHDQSILDASFKISVVDSAIDVKCQFNAIMPNYLYLLWFQAQEITQTVVNLSAFQMGVGALTVLDHWTNLEGKSDALALAGAHLTGLCTVFDQDPEGDKFDQTVRMVFSEPALFTALNDLILSNVNPRHLLINCARCVEAIRTMIAGPEVD